MEHSPAKDLSDLSGFSLFETLRVQEGKAWWADEHFKRLRDSVKFFSLPELAGVAWQEQLQKVPRSGDWVVRLTYRAFGGRWQNCPVTFRLDVLFQRFSPAPNPLRCTWGAYRLAQNDFLRGHKSGSRMVWDLMLHQAKQLGFDDIWICDRADSILETAVGNLFLFTDRWYTPPLELGLLPGILRQKVLGTGAVETLNVPANAKIRAAVRGNSVAGLTPIQTIGDCQLNLELARDWIREVSRQVKLPLSG
ncbi:MAG: aminotransferase class IV [Acidobacteria bacterium]|nr:aminotransferase class IV [Acidobacteriota bacterium]MCB9398994.1 aminotransferase class IV [Acidobacteriota bacterium]